MEFLRLVYTYELDTLWCLGVIRYKVGASASDVDCPFVNTSSQRDEKCLPA